MKLQRYPAYKPSGIEWIGEIPAHWEVRKLKYLGRMYAGLANKKGDDFSKDQSVGMRPFIPFTNIFNNVVIDNTKFQYVKIDNGEYQNVVLKGDILFLMSSETLEDIGKTALYNGENEVFLNSFCKGFRVEKEKIENRYLNWLLQSNMYRTYFSIVGRGFTRINIKQDYVNNLITLLPPKDEQTKIADFLDRQTKRIDQAVTLKERIIECLEEQRRILIHRAVTRGLDPHTPTKPSGIEWIGEIPAHWKIFRGIKIFSENKRKNIGLIEKRVLSLSYGEIIKKSKDKLYGLVPDSFETYQIVETGDIIVRCTDLQNDKTSLRTSISNYNGIITSAYLNLKILQGSPKYYHYFLRAMDIVKYIYLLGSGLRQNLSFEDFKNLKVVFPPIDEQTKIVEYIEKETAKIDRAITLQRQEIEKLKEYKASLIDSVVTGKVWVV